MLAPLRRLANSVGGNIARLSTRGTLSGGELRSAQAPNAAPPVWFVFTGARRVYIFHPDPSLFLSGLQRADWLWWHRTGENWYSLAKSILVLPQSPECMGALCILCAGSAQARAAGLVEAGRKRSGEHAAVWLAWAGLGLRYLGERMKLPAAMP
jgi:hypothetical protein